MEKLLTLTAAIGMDMALGEPPARLHPVVWIGRLISLFDRLNPEREGRRGIFSGIRIVLAVLAVVIESVLFVNWRLRKIPAWLRLLPSAWLLKTTFSLRELWQAGDKVARHLDEGQTDQARADLQALVSRDVTNLDGPRLAAAAIESVAENTSDSFVGPVFYYSLFGLPGAFVYRAINTLDSMIGYHDEYEYVGKFAARLDDAVNFIPARLTASLCALASVLGKRDFRSVWKGIRRDARKTESPNAGYPMSAMAGALGVELEKVGHYKLGSPGSLPGGPSIAAAIRLSKMTCLLMIPIAILVEVLRHARKA
jgi:adenosylcobinamide-phosphate synthase